VVKLLLLQLVLQIADALDRQIRQPLARLGAVALSPGYHCAHEVFSQLFPKVQGHSTQYRCNGLSASLRSWVSALRHDDGPAR